MIFHDSITISIGNLWRIKFRTILTVAGIVIAIAAFVSMVSFGAGTKENIDKQFDQLGLLSTIQVYPQRRPNDPESFKSPRLDVAALDRFAKIKGVLMVYPYDPFKVTIRLGDSTIDSRAQSLSHNVMETKLFSKMRAGTIFASDSSRSAIISSDLLKKAGFRSADSVINLPPVSVARAALPPLASARGGSTGGTSPLQEVRNGSGQ